MDQACLNKIMTYAYLEFLKLVTSLGNLVYIALPFEITRLEIVVYLCNNQTTKSGYICALNIISKIFLFYFSYVVIM